MASMTFDLQWKEAMVELLDQLQEIDPEVEGSEAFEKLEAASDAEKFQMYGTLYIRYLQIFRALEESYDMTVHPQKRMDVKKTLEACGQARTLGCRRRCVAAHASIWRCGRRL